MATANYFDFLEWPIQTACEHEKIERTESFSRFARLLVRTEDKECLLCVFIIRIVVLQQIYRTGVSKYVFIQRTYMEFVSTISTNVHTHAHKDCTYILHYIVDAIPYFGPSHLLFCTQRLYMRDLIGPLLFVSLMTVSLRIFAFKQVRPWKVNSVELWGYDARRMTALGVLCHDIGDIWPKGSARGSLTASGSDTEPIVGRRVIRSYQIRTLERRPADQTPHPHPWAVSSSRDVTRHSLAM